MNTKIRNSIAATVAFVAVAAPITAVTVTANATPAASPADTSVFTTATGNGADSTANTNDPTATINGDGSGTVAAMHRYGESATASGSTNWSTMYEVLDFTLKDIDGFWTNVFASAGYPAPYVDYAFTQPGESLTIGCNPGATNDRTAAYCSADDAIYVSQAMMTTIWDGSMVGPDGQTIDSGGDFAVATVIAHEYAHNLQHELELDVNHTVPQIEKQADCLAGVWANDAARRNLLDPGDLDEGLKAMFLVGDSDYSDPGHHGTSAERQAAFQTGFDTGSGKACDAYLAS
jgi:uncharacterized protein